MTGDDSDTAAAPRPGDTAAAAPQQSQHVAAAAAELDAVTELPLDEQADTYQRIHGRLQDALAAIDDA